MNIANLGMAGVSTTGQKSASVLIGQSKRENLQFSWDCVGALTAFTLQLEGRYFEPLTSMTVVDSADADLAAFFDTTGALYLALRRAPAVGDVFEVLGVGDVTDNALATAKGGAVASGDLFVVSDIGTEAVVYIPNEGFVGLHTAVTQATALKSIAANPAPRVRAVTSSTWTAALIVDASVVY